MVLTIDFIKENFGNFNSLYFGGKLETPKFVIKHSKQYLGTCKWSNRLPRDINGISLKTDFTIEISDYYDRAEKDYQNTLLHEMVHQYIRQFGLERDGVHHGKAFKTIAYNLNKKGWNIETRTKMFNVKVNPKYEETYELIALHYKNCKFLVRYNPNSLIGRKIICGTFNKNNIIDYFTFSSNDSSKYGSYPKCTRRFSGHIISDEDYNNLKENVQLKLAV